MPRPVSVLVIVAPFRSGRCRLDSNTRAASRQLETIDDRASKLKATVSIDDRARGARRPGLRRRDAGARLRGDLREEELEGAGFIATMHAGSFLDLHGLSVVARRTFDEPAEHRAQPAGRRVDDRDPVLADLGDPEPGRERLRDRDTYDLVDRRLHGEEEARVEPETSNSAGYNRAK